MKDKCQNCSGEDNTSLILMTKTESNVTYPKFYCSTCITIAIKSLNPHTFPQGMTPDRRTLKDILDADKLVFNKCWDIFNKKTPHGETLSKIVAAHSKPRKVHLIDNSSPSTIYSQLNEYIIGQEDAKRKLSLAIRRKAMSEANESISKINLMMIGPTASGKTEMARVVSNLVDVPFVKIDCSHLTPSGYKGVNVDSILLRLYEAAGGNTERAQTGIVLLDEFDKIIRNGEFSSRIQQELLKLIEGDIFSFEIDKHKPLQKMDTSGILFIAAGSFPGIEMIVSPKNTNVSLVKKSHLEILKDAAAPMVVESKHLIKYGLIPELVGRFTHTATLKKLEAKELYEIMTSKKGNIADEYKAIFREMGHEVNFPKEFLMDIAEKAGQSETGARNLKFLMEEALGEYLFDETCLPDNFLSRVDVKLSA